MQSEELASKLLELLREVRPGLAHLAIMGDRGNASVLLEMGELRKTARTLGVEVDAIEIEGADDIASAFQSLKDTHTRFMS